MAYVPRVQKYKAPTWPRLPIKAPSRKINGLAAVPTPVQSINASDLLDGAAIKISIKRDDIIGFGLSGNKVLDDISAFNHERILLALASM